MGDQDSQVDEPAPSAADEGEAPDAVATAEVAAEAEGPEGGGGGGGGGEHADAKEGETPSANKKAPPAMPVWRKKRPSLIGSRVRALLEKQFDEAAEAFECIDMNQDGKISMRELRAALAVLEPSVEFSDDELRQAIKIADYDGSGAVDKQEFLRAFGPHPLFRGEVEDGLHTMGKTADGKKLAFLSLGIAGINLNDLTLLREFPHLRHINVSNNMLSDLSPLGCLPHLLTLDASDNLLTAVLAFKPPLCLHTADLSRNRITTINPLAQHRFLETLTLSGNRIRQISGVRDNVALRRLTLDNNFLTEISNLGSLPLRHLSVRDNHLSAVVGYAPLTPQVQAVFDAFEESFEEMELAFQALDANQDGRIGVKEFAAGLEMVGIKAGKATVDEAMALLDKSGDGWVQPNEFLALMRRAGALDQTDVGIADLQQLETLDLSGNVISSLRGLEGHPCLRRIDVSRSGVCEVTDMQFVQGLAMLEELNLHDTPLFAKAASLAEASCMRLRVLHQLAPPKGRCTLDMLNGKLVAAEEMVSAANFHDEEHQQYQDRKRDDSQDVPPALFL